MNLHQNTTPLWPPILQQEHDQPTNAVLLSLIQPSHGISPWISPTLFSDFKKATTRKYTYLKSIARGFEHSSHPIECFFITALKCTLHWFPTARSSAGFQPCQHQVNILTEERLRTILIDFRVLQRLVINSLPDFHIPPQRLFPLSWPPPPRDDRFFFKNQADWFDEGLIEKWTETDLEGILFGVKCSGVLWKVSLIYGLV